MPEMTERETKELELFNLHEQLYGAEILIDRLKEELAKAENLKATIEGLIKEAKESLETMEEDL